MSILDLNDEIVESLNFSLADTETLFLFLKESPKLPKSLGYNIYYTLEALRRRVLEYRENRDKQKTEPKTKPWFIFISSRRDFEFDKRFESWTDREALLEFMQIVWKEVDFTIIQWNIWKKRVLRYFNLLQSINNPWEQRQSEIDKTKLELSILLEELESKLEESQSVLNSFETNDISLDPQAQKIYDNIQNMTEIVHRNISNLTYEIDQRRAIFQRLRTMMSIKSYIIFILVSLYGGIIFVSIFLNLRKKSRK